MKPGDNNKLELLRILQHLHGAKNVVTEHIFHPKRKWRFDMACPSCKVACEYQGHGHTGGGHIGGHAGIVGMTGDCEKYNAAMNLGWRVYLFTALYFRQRDRDKHKLTAPIEILRQNPDTGRECQPEITTD